MNDDVTVDDWVKGQTEANRTGRVHVLIGNDRHQHIEPLDEVRFRMEYNGGGYRIAVPTLFKVFFPRMRKGDGR